MASEPNEIANEAKGNRISAKVDHEVTVLVSLYGLEAQI